MLTTLQQTNIPRPLGLSRYLPRTHQGVDALFILTNRCQDVVLLQLVQVRHPQFVGLEAGKLEGAGQEPDLTFHMCGAVKEPPLHGDLHLDQKPDN